jgi:hypothetical protein
MEIQRIKRNKSRMQIQTMKSKRKIKTKIIIFSILIILYLGISIYFSTHFYFGSVINNISASGKTVEKLDKEILSKYEAYTLDLKERNGVKEQITAADIGLKYNAKGKIQLLQDKQNSFMWVHALFNPEDSELNGMVIFDEKLLKKYFDKLSCFDVRQVIEPKNASIKYSGTGYLIVNEVIGNKVNRERLYADIVNAIRSGKTTVDLEAKNHYINPKYTSSSKQVKNTKILLDKYIASKITYTSNKGKEVIDGSIIHNWIGLDENFEVSFNEIEMKNHLGKIDNNYDTFGKEREFITSLKTKIKISGGNYGWLVNRKGEVSTLIAAIKSGQTISTEPKYIQTAISHNFNDIGDTYVEINMTRQHLWFYKNGTLVVHGDVVTGDVSRKYDTPTGVYSLLYKEKNSKLVGEGYSVPVGVFMPFNGNIGIHDASWRDVFGGSEYLTKGSHGCINSPINLAHTIYNNIDAGTPVICYQ